MFVVGSDHDQKFCIDYGFPLEKEIVLMETVLSFLGVFFGKEG